LRFNCVTCTTESFFSTCVDVSSRHVLNASNFPSLTALHLSHCPQLDDHAWEALPKKTRMHSLRSLNLSLGRSVTAAQSAPAISKGRMGSASNTPLPEAKKKFTDQGLNSQINPMLRISTQSDALEAHHCCVNVFGDFSAARLLSSSDQPQSLESHSPLSLHTAECDLEATVHPECDPNTFGELSSNFSSMNCAAVET
jgi:hypothetical protein